MRLPAFVSIIVSITVSIGGIVGIAAGGGAVVGIVGIVIGIGGIVAGIAGIADGAERPKLFSS